MGNLTQTTLQGTILQGGPALPEESVHTFYKWSLWVETIETSYGWYWDDLGKVDDYKYNEWNAMCVTVDHEAGKQTVFVNGEYVDEKLVED